MLHDEDNDDGIRIRAAPKSSHKHTSRPRPGHHTPTSRPRPGHKTPTSRPRPGHKTPTSRPRPGHKTPTSKPHTARPRTSRPHTNAPKPQTPAPKTAAPQTAAPQTPAPQPSTYASVNCIHQNPGTPVAGQPTININTSGTPGVNSGSLLFPGLTININVNVSW